MKNDFVYYESNDQKRRGFDRKRVSLRGKSRQDLNHLAPWSVELDEDDLHASFEGVQTPETAKKLSVTVADETIKHVKQLLKQHQDMYIFRTNDQKESPDILLWSKKWSEGSKQAFAELKKEDDQRVFTG